MRLVVFSDSHNNYAALKSIYQLHPEAEGFVFLGDGEQDFFLLKEQAEPRYLMLHVKGNCDLASSAKAVDFVTVAGKKIMFTHGHLQNVKHDLEILELEARANDCHIALFGHTHHAITTYRDGLYLMNPGSVTLPNGGPPTYGLLDITEGGIFCSLAKWKRT